MCDKRIGHNKFYDPEIKKFKKKNKYSNYNINLNEKQALFKELVKNGMDEETARRRVNNRCRYIRWFQMKRRSKKRDEGNKEIMKRLLEGIGQK